MNAESKVYVSSDLDVVMARLQARKMAKQMGFRAEDQSRISLATSELARVLSWKNNAPGEIVFSSTRQNGQQGLQVTCLVRREYISPADQSNTVQEIPIPNRCLAGARKLVDESIVETLDSQKARITLITWLN